jgi:uncharacterized protein involved in cysteine biosynthesis
VAVMLVLLMEKHYEVCSWNRFRWDDTHTKTHDDWFKHLNSIMVITTTILEAVMLLLLMGGIYNVGHWDGFRWHDIHTKFHKD